MGTALGGPPPVLLYDGDCPLCRAAADWLGRRVTAGGGVELLAAGAPDRHARFPAISDDACRSAMQLVLPDGRVLAGADAVPELLMRLRGLGWLAGLFALPGMRPLARRLYGWIAGNRMRLSCPVTRRVR